MSRNRRVDWPFAAGPLIQIEEGNTMDQFQSPIALADDAYEAIRAINHRTMWAKLPAPVVYTILGSLKGVGHLLPQALNQLASGLGRSLDEYAVYEDDDRDPVQSVTIAADHLSRAIQFAAALGDALELAQSAIAHQGYREEGDCPSSVDSKG